MTGRGEVTGLTPAERAALLEVAREALAVHLASGAAAAPRPDSPGLRRPGAAFVTLRRRADRALRGCRGELSASGPLVGSVARMAVAAGVGDTRFEPLRVGELASLSIEISALGPTRPIRPEAVEVGRHGLVLEHRGRRGLLLPQVPLEHGWGREAFLDGLCRKAGLDEAAWREPGAQLLAFEAEWWGEE